MRLADVPAPYSQRAKIGALLPDFTHFKDLNLPQNIPEEKVSTFLMMYRTHCQRILDTVMRASFDEIQSFLLHFWKGMPSHIASMLGTNALVNVIGVCDLFVYKAISNVLFPSVHQALPDSLVQLIRKFSKELTVWLRMALGDVPENLRELKLELAKCFSRTLRRQTSLNHLCQASRMVIHNADITSQMLHDWRHVDMDNISRQTLFTVQDDNPATTSTEIGGGDANVGVGTGATVELITSLYKEFETLLEDQAPIEAYVEWLDSLIERCVVQPSRKRKSSIRRLARQFLLMWSCFGTRVIRDMTLHSAPSFGSFHLLHLTFDDYVLFLMESVHWEERTQELFANIANDTPPLLNCSIIDDGIVDSEVGMCKLKWFSSQSQGAVVADHALAISSTSSLPIPSPSSHSHASSNDVMTHNNSPVGGGGGGGGSGVFESNMSIDDDVKPRDDTSEKESEPFISDYTPMAADQYPSSYHYQTTQDTRAIYAYNSSVPTAGHLVDNRTAVNNSCHPGNRYIMKNSVVEGVDCGANRNLISANPARCNGDVVNSNVEYANFVQYSGGRRGDYTDCHGYGGYEQSPPSPPQPPPPGPAPSVIYAPANCYYQPSYDSGGVGGGGGGNNVTTTTADNVPSTTALGCCSSCYPVTSSVGNGAVVVVDDGGASDSAGNGKLDRFLDAKLPDGMSGLGYNTVGGGGGGGGDGDDDNGRG